MTVVSAIFRIRRDTAANWASVNPVLKLGEPGLETDTRRIKYGDGSTAWNSLGYGVGDPRSGTSFPSSPATGARFTRTDRNIEYFYDGTRWLSTQLFEMATHTPNSVANTVSGNTNNDMGNPWAGKYAIYLEELVFTSRQTVGTTASNYFTAQIYDTTTAATVGAAISAQNNTAGAYEADRVTINAVVASTSHNLRVFYTLTGTATAILNAAIVYRLIG
ncbi:MAG TPA: hypothetical protein VM760_08870 [Sphingomicrobium sp.]|nr:hypothetical protein [Sphingomicrobium sp.]